MFRNIFCVYDINTISIRIYFRSQFFHNNPIYGYISSNNKLFGFAARGIAKIGNVFLQSDTRHSTHTIIHPAHKGKVCKVHLQGLHM